MSLETGAAMFSEADETIHRLRHEKNVWRGIAIGLAATLVLLITLGGVGGLLMAKRSQVATMFALEERERAEQARMEAEQAAKVAAQERRRAEAARQAAEKPEGLRP
jgi:hypothetical protein